MGRNSARAMMGVNIFLAALTFIIFFWSSYKLVIANEDKHSTMSKYVSNTRKQMKKLRYNTEKSMAELDNIDSTDDEMFHSNSYKVFDSPDTSSSASDTDFSDF